MPTKIALFGMVFTILGFGLLVQQSLRIRNKAKEIEKIRNPNTKQVIVFISQTIGASEFVLSAGVILLIGTIAWALHM